jgi:hypothetical protein
MLVVRQTEQLDRLDFLGTGSRDRLGTRGMAKLLFLLWLEPEHQMKIRHSEFMVSGTKR